MESHGLEMTGAIASADGVETITIANTTGKVTIAKDLEVDGTTQFDGDILITGGSPTAEQVVFTADAQGTLSYANASVPAGEIIIFEDNTAVTGYSLLTTFDDGVIYITKGSAAGGETGGTNKSGGTWTQPNHDHGGYTGYHTLTLAEIPAHRHTSPVDFFSPVNYSHEKTGDKYGDAYYTDYTGGGQGHRHTLGTITSDATPNTWRPYGRNFTRQVKN